MVLQPALVHWGGLLAVGWAGRCWWAGAGRGVDGASVVPLSWLLVTAVANSPTASPAQAACGLGGAWTRVRRLYVRRRALEWARGAPFVRGPLWGPARNNKVPCNGIKY